ncbi:MAG: hypothetical protein ACYS0C_07675 [Planctomycetota bacterium]
MIKKAVVEAGVAGTILTTATGSRVCAVQGHFIRQISPLRNAPHFASVEMTICSVRMTERRCSETHVIRTL